MDIFVSDIHLGSRHSQAEKCLEFLESVTPQRLYLIGDIIDGWRLSRKWYWPEEHTRLLQKIVSLADEGVEVVYVAGNHDEFLRAWVPCSLGKIKIVNHADFEVGGKKYLVIHGDFFDYLMRSSIGRKIMYFGDFAYDTLMYINYWMNRVRKLFGLPYWSLSKYLKLRTKQVSSYIGDFEGQMVAYARRKGYDGIIAGHIHAAANKNINEIHYLNTGDWVESCTALIHSNNQWKLVEKT